LGILGNFSTYASTEALSSLGAGAGVGFGFRTDFFFGDFFDPPMLFPPFVLSLNFYDPFPIALYGIPA
jgi:hypothetical protein